MRVCDNMRADDHGDNGPFLRCSHVAVQAAAGAAAALHQQLNTAKQTAHRSWQSLLSYKQCVIAVLQTQVRYCNMHA